MLTDVHTHLTDPRLAAMEGEVLARAAAAGLSAVISNGLNVADNAAVRALAARHPLVRPAYGLYPVDAVLPEMIAAGVEYKRDDGPVLPAEEAVAQVRALIDEAVAVGEIGLDGYWVPELLWGRQEEVLRQLLAVAVAADKPVILHTRKRERRMMEIVEEQRLTRVCWHCFGGKVKLAMKIAELEGQYFSIPANARRSESFTRLLEKLPRDKVLLETDAPYLGPVPGALNEPANIAGTADYAATLWGCSPGEAREQLAANTRALFGEL
ncbi:MAG: TatD family hydrolase [Deltaproteobacteria bacterium]|nr:TatD family hydrolase [Deltaproteobacteria bacterium]